MIRLRTPISVLQEEFDTKEQDQEEMLRLFLKWFIIPITKLETQQLFNQ